MKKLILILILALFLLSGCKTTQDVQYVDRDVVRYVDRLVKDSVHIYNTDTVKIQQKGDTIYYTNIKWRIEYRDKIKRDTVSKIVEIAKTVEKPVEVIKNRFGFLDWTGLTALLSLFLFIVYKLRRFFI